jgi:hypothetical protein
MDHKFFENEAKFENEHIIQNYIHEEVGKRLN